MSKIESFLSKVYKTNEFYRNIAETQNITDPTDITQYPILNRSQLQKNRYDMFSDGYKAKYFSQRLRRQSSSGTSGVPVHVYWDEREYRSSIIRIWRMRLKYYNIRSTDARVSFTLAAFSETFGEDVLSQKQKNVLSINCSSLQSEESFLKLVKLINDFSPIWLYIQPFILRKLMFCYKENNISPPNTLRYIEVVGEVFPNDLREKAKQFFGVPIANLYGTEEMNGIAYECPYGRIHVLEDNVFIECKNQDGICEFGTGEAIITNLQNIAMPLIRYNQGDVITIKNNYGCCTCGLSSPVVTEIKGRIHSCININGITINSFLLCEVVSEVNNQLGDLINEYKFVYSYSKNEIHCYFSVIKSANLWIDTIMEQLNAVFKSKISIETGIIFKTFNVLKVPHKMDRKFDVIQIID